VKVFDFGLSKSLCPALKAHDDRGRPVYGYNLTPRTGKRTISFPASSGWSQNGSTFGRL
jgi:hypothetical protein